MRRVALMLAFVSLAGCDQRIPETGKIPLGSLSTADAGALTGVVQEHLAAPPYTYLRLKTDNGDRWAAVPQGTFENGMSVTVYNPMQMTAFESKTLNRTFDEVYFGTTEAPAAAAGATGGDPHAGIGQAPAPFDVGTVEKAGGAEGRTVAEVWSGRAALEGKPVAVRGKVVKVNDGVMGKNWIHIRDGSGSAQDGSNDLAVTTQERVGVGETVIIRGVVRTNKDFGAGYFYQVIVEDASVEKMPSRS